MNDNVRIHPTADVSPQAEIGSSTRIRQGVQAREGVLIGAECILGKNVCIDFDVRIGDRCKIQNNVSVFLGAILEDGVFLRPHCPNPFLDKWGAARCGRETPLPAE